MSRPITATVHPAALQHNLGRIRAAAPDARVFAVVKADAYGHGIERVFDALRGADGFALLDLAEAERLRALDWRGPILLLEGVFEPRDLELCSRLNLWHMVHCTEQIDWLAAHKTRGEGHRVFLKLNSGMNRLGFAPEAFRSAWARLQALPQVAEITAATHLANADRGDSPGLQDAPAALAAFARLTADLPGERSVANSAAALLLPRAGGGDWVRAGIALYGSAPDYPRHSAADLGLAPTMSLRSRLIAVQQVARGACVGYGATYTCEKDERIGIVACGYADGYPRHAPTGTPVRVGGVLTETVGRVSMDMLAVRLDGIPEAGVGTPVTLWGHDAGAPERSVPVDAVAAAAGTIAYELLCAVAPRVGRAVADAADEAAVT